MSSVIDWFWRAIASLPALALCGCMGFSGSGPETTAATDVAAARAGGGESSGTEEIDIRKFLGPNYCPELRIREGREIVRTFERGHEDEAESLIWQASIGRTARECFYELDGSLTLKVGVSGRVVAGPKGGAGIVPLPLRIGVVKYQEAVLSDQSYPLSVSIPQGGSTVFTEVHEIVVPSPGSDRDYIVYVGLDGSKEDLLAPPQLLVADKEPEPQRQVAAAEEVAAAAEEGAPAAQPPPAAEPQQKPASGPVFLPIPEGTVPGGW